MFSKIAVIAISVLATVTGVSSTPLSVRRSELVPRTFQSFSNWGGLSSLANFDDFYGIDNFDGSRCSQTVIVPTQSLFCHSQTVEIVQQRLLVIQEMAKKIITETICDVETQTIVFEQWHAGLGGFSDDLRRISGRQVGFDQSIFSHQSSLINVDGSLTTHDLGFSGHDLGRNTVLVNGHNWDNSRSFISVGAAYLAARGAVVSIH
ncbi:hypothetical protein D9756_003394 [Leucocoprinus leucothites]|uniref:Uncharacterized protein n=1 Tax=Leucocoprinus leucothites TaxID=201217 RepID=A0A8H5G6Y9_9AGAR|nr:hypothetical protein D9756_003394 [Leucoagaricus leucothites]